MSESTSPAGTLPGGPDEQLHRVRRVGEALLEQRHHQRADVRALDADDHVGEAALLVVGEVQARDRGDDVTAFELVAQRHADGVNQVRVVRRCGCARGEQGPDVLGVRVPAQRVGRGTADERRRRPSSRRRASVATAAASTSGVSDRIRIACDAHRRGVGRRRGVPAARRRPARRAGAAPTVAWTCCSGVRSSSAARHASGTAAVPTRSTSCRWRHHPHGEVRRRPAPLTSSPTDAADRSGTFGSGRLPSLAAVHDPPDPPARRGRGRGVRGGTS